MDDNALHNDAIIIDGLEICRWSRDVFEDMHGGLTAVNLYVRRVGRFSCDGR